MSKRKIDLTSAPEGPQRPAPHRREQLHRALDRPAEQQQASEFRSAIRSLLIEKTKELDQQYARQVKSYDIPEEMDSPDGRPVHYLDDAREYLRRSDGIQYLYGRVAGESISFGSDDALQLGHPSNLELVEKGTNVDSYPPQLIGGLGYEVRQVAAGGVHSVAVKANGRAYTWGAPDDGALGRDVSSDEGLNNDDDDYKSVKPFPVKKLMTLSGENHDNQVVAVAAGDSHTLFLSASGEVFSTGMYKDADSGKFCDIASPNASPDGVNKFPVHVFQMPQKVRYIASGGGINAAILEDETMVTWGMGIKGELARSADMSRPDANGNYNLGSSLYTREVRDDEGEVVDKEVIEEVLRERFLKPLPPRWATGPNLKRVVLDVACGGNHILVTARDPGQFASKLYSSGLNNYGQLGHGDCGDNTERHELTLVKALENKNITKVAAGEHFSLALNHLGCTLYSWGRGDYGQLGNNKRSEPYYSEDSPIKVAFPSETRVLLLDISAGDRHAFAITVEQEVYSWGFNECGTCGIPSEQDIYLPTKLNLEDSLGYPTRVHNASGGGQHSVMVVKRYAKQA